MYLAIAILTWSLWHVSSYAGRLCGAEHGECETSGTCQMPPETVWQIYNCLWHTVNISKRAPDTDLFENTQPRTGKWTTLQFCRMFQLRIWSASSFLPKISVWGAGTIKMILSIFRVYICSAVTCGYLENTTLVYSPKNYDWIIYKNCNAVKHASHQHNRAKHKFQNWSIRNWKSASQFMTHLILHVKENWKQWSWMNMEARNEKGRISK